MLPVGKGDFVSTTGLRVFTHVPASYRGERLMVVCHGMFRNAEDYRNGAIGMAEALGAAIAAPLFDEERFPNEKYQRGGIVHPDGSSVPEADWTYALLPGLLDEIRARLSTPPGWTGIIGHSAGGQFVMRLAGFVTLDVDRLISANPGTCLFPTLDAPFGYGFGSLPPEIANEARLRQYLAQPLTLYLGTADNIVDEWLDDSPEGMRQGAGRLQRGIAANELAQTVAKERQWPLHWRVVTAEGIGHDYEAMFSDPSLRQAL